MPQRKVVRKAISRIRSILNKEQARTRTFTPKRAESLFKRLKNADYRTEESAEHRKEMRRTGFRVREMQVKGTKGVILKLAETEHAKHDIRMINKLVSLINKTFPEKSYTLLKPKGHALGAFVGMEKIDKPNIVEIIGGKRAKTGELIQPTERGEKFITELAKRLNDNPDRLKYQLYLESEEVKKHAQEVIAAQKIRPTYANAFAKRNLLPIDYKKGHFVFMQILDLY